MHMSHYHLTSSTKPVFTTIFDSTELQFYSVLDFVALQTN